MQAFVILLSILIVVEYSSAFLANSKRQGTEPCPLGQARCPSPDSPLCIPLRWFCDGDNDCGDNSDENPVHCPTLSCPPSQIRCPTSGSRRCIPHSSFCDGVNDCGDHSDENPAQCPETGGEDSALQQCSMSLQLCVMPITSQLQGMSQSEIEQVLRKTPLRQLCQPVLQTHSCVSNVLQTQCDNVPEIQDNTDLENSLSALHVTINFICRDHVDELEQTKNCLLDNTVQIAEAWQQCATGPGNRRLVPSSLGHFQCPSLSELQCAHGVMMSHCGAESGRLYSELATLVIHEMGCTPSKLKRVLLAEKGMDLKILKKAFKWMF